MYIYLPKHVDMYIHIYIYLYIYIYINVHIYNADKKDTKDSVWEVSQQVNARKAMEVYKGEHRVAHCQQVYRNPVGMGGHDEVDV